MRARPNCDKPVKESIAGWLGLWRGKPNVKPSESEALHDLLAEMWDSCRSGPSDATLRHAILRHYPVLEQPEQIAELMEQIFEETTKDYFSRQAGVDGKGLAYVFGLHRVVRAVYNAEAANTAPLDMKEVTDKAMDTDVNEIVTKGEEVVLEIARFYEKACREQGVVPNGGTLDVAITGFVAYMAANADTHPKNLMHSLLDAIAQGRAYDQATT